MTPDPVSTTPTVAGGGLLASLLVAVFGADGTEYAAIFGASIAGALWPLSRRDEITRREGALLVAKLAGTSMCLTGAIVWWLRDMGWVAPLNVTTVAASFAISAMGDNWLAIFSAAAERLRAFVGGGVKP